MIIGIFSDTHDNITQIKRAAKTFENYKVEAIIHAGDIVAPFAAKTIAEIPIPLYIVYGNNDGEREGLKNILPQIADGPILIDLNHKIIVLAHDFTQITEDSKEQADIIISGHTHLAEIKKYGNRLQINPGDCSGWLKGRASVAILETETMKAQIIELPL